MKKVFRNPLLLALDVDTKEEALRIADATKDSLGGIKLGPRLVYRYGADFVREMAAKAPVFIDCKFFDIPSTMESAVKAAFEAGASLCTVHAMSGPVALKAMAELEKKLNEQRPFQILAVTMLTSFSEDALPANVKKQSIKDHVRELARATVAAGMTGIVCSGEELPLFREDPSLAGLMKVVPGIRLPSDDVGDQKRVMGPKEAMLAGASALVVGRPIVAAKDASAAARTFADLLR